MVEIKIRKSKMLKYIIVTYVYKILIYNVH